MTRFVLTLIGVAIQLGAFMYLLVDLLSSHPRAHKIDCSLASFHPDIPKDVRKTCRERGEV